MDYNYEYNGGDIDIVANVSMASDCCKVCENVTDCRAWTWNKLNNNCALKSLSGWTPISNANATSGIVGKHECNHWKKSSNDIF